MRKWQASTCTPCSRPSLLPKSIPLDCPAILKSLLSLPCCAALPAVPRHRFAAALALSLVQFSLQGPQLCCKRERQWQWQQAKKSAELHLLPIAGVQLCDWSADQRSACWETVDTA